MKSGVKLRGQLGVVVKLLDLIAKDPAQHQRELSRDREFVRMALSAENGVAEAIATLARHSELWAQTSEPLSFKGSTAEYVFALAADGLKSLRSDQGQIRDGRLLPTLTPEQILFLNRIDQGAAMERPRRMSAHRIRCRSASKVQPGPRAAVVAVRSLPIGSVLEPDMSIGGVGGKKQKRPTKRRASSFIGVQGFEPR